MDRLRSFLLGTALIASTLVSAYSQSESRWSFDSKAAIPKPAATMQEVVGRQIANIEMTQFDAWNRHDLPAFLSYYWKSSGLISIANQGTVIGYDAFADHLREQFEADPSAMGTVRVEHLQVNVLTADTACVVSSYVCEIKGKSYYCDDTEVLKVLDGAWRIAFENANIRVH
jgi:uncharacterized protein (TIGR02246 family)